MRAGQSSAEALAELTAADPLEHERQVAMIDARGRVAVHTGAECLPFAGHAIGEHHSAQANLMATGRGVGGDVVHLYGERRAAGRTAAGRARRGRGGGRRPARAPVGGDPGRARRPASPGSGWSRCGSRTTPSRSTSCAAWSAWTAPTRTCRRSPRAGRPNGDMDGAAAKFVGGVGALPGSDGAPLLGRLRPDPPGRGGARRGAPARDPRLPRRLGEAAREADPGRHSGARPRPRSARPQGRRRRLGRVTADERRRARSGSPASP